MYQNTEWIARFIHEEIQRAITKERKRIVSELEKSQAAYVFRNTERAALTREIITAIAGNELDSK